MEMLSGIIEIDETYVGGKAKNRHKNAKVIPKTPVIGLLQRGGNVRTFVVENVNSETIYKIVTENVAPTSVIMTDCKPLYFCLDDKYEHHMCNHKNKKYVLYGDIKIHVNTLEGFWSILKKTYHGTYHHISKKHLQGYCDEIAFRYNNRDLSAQERLEKVLSGMSNTRLTYKQLIGKK